MLYPVELWVHGEPVGSSETGIISGLGSQVNLRQIDRFGFGDRSGYDGFRTRPDNLRGVCRRPSFSNHPLPVEQITEQKLSLSETRRSPVTARKFIPLAAAFGLWAAGPAVAQQFAPAPMSAAARAENQKLADDVAAKLKSSGAVPKGAKVDIKVVGGVVDLTGSVATAEQHQEILRAISRVSGNKRIERGTMMGDAGRPQRPAGQSEALAPPPASPPPRPMPSYGAVTSAAPPPMGGGFSYGPVTTSEPVPMNGMPAMAP